MSIESRSKVNQSSRLGKTQKRQTAFSCQARPRFHTCYQPSLPRKFAAIVTFLVKNPSLSLITYIFVLALATTQSSTHRAYEHPPHQNQNMSTSTLRPVLRRTTPLLQTATRAFTTTPNRPLAKIQLIGRLAADPELHATSTGKDVLRYAIGTTHQTKDGPQTSWWRVACFDEGGRREYVQGLTKG